MVEKTKNDASHNKRAKILYRSALICYLIPFLFLGISFLDFFSSQELFWRMFLMSMFPFGLLGLLFSILGIVQSSRLQYNKNKMKGYYSLYMGILVIAGGIIAWILLYLVNNS